MQLIEFRNADLFAQTFGCCVSCSSFCDRATAGAGLPRASTVHFPAGNSLAVAEAFSINPWGVGVCFQTLLAWEGRRELVRVRSPSRSELALFLRINSSNFFCQPPADSVSP